jgi:hypothetical protein
VIAASRSTLAIGGMASVLEARECANGRRTKACTVRPYWDTIPGNPGAKFDTAARQQAKTGANG